MGGVSRGKAMGGGEGKGHGWGVEGKGGWKTVISILLT